MSSRIFPASPRSNTKSNTKSRFGILLARICSFCSGTKRAANGKIDALSLPQCFTMRLGINDVVYLC